jgi:hypothetical protein
MAQVLLLKISSSDGIPLEMDSAADEITLLTGKFGNMKLASNSLTSEDANGNINIEPNGTGDVVMQGLTYPAADGSAGQTIVTDGAGTLSFDSPNASQVCNSYTADEALAQNDVVYISAADNVSKADVSGAGAASRVVGIAQAAAADTNPVIVCSEGVQGNFVGLTAGARYYADPGAAGGITATTPVGSGNTVVQVGYAKSATELHIHIEQLGRRA